MPKSQEFELEDFLIGDEATNSIPTSQDQDQQGDDHQTTVKTVNYQGQQIKILPKDWRHSNLLKFQILICFCCMVIVGINDQTVGTLIPTLTHHYNTEQTTISTVFALQFLGYATSALSNEHLHVKFGRRGVMILSNAFLLITYLVNSFKPPIFIYIGIYYFAGLGVGLLDSCMTVWLSSLVDHNEIMGLLHGFYGIGSVFAPPYISHLLKWFNSDFKYHYITLSVVSSLGVIACSILFKNESKLKYEYDHKIAGNHDDDVEQDHGSNLKKVLKMPTVLIFSAYLFLYIGAEVSIGSWLLSYLMKIKNLDQIQSSYIVSWFWIGLTIGRILLGFVTKYFKNEYRANLYYASLSLICYLIYSLFTLSISSEYKHFTIWTNILVIICGIFIGPLFPTGSITLMKILPSNLHVSSVGIMTSLGGSGAAILPFFVGILTHATSLEILPILISLMIIGYVMIWWFIPKVCHMHNYDF
ncbi:putative permease [Wickerhamomyces ciferrii]|uniref:Permease n=1 Tax=Wickerhamomyces ciferrii (strain ATCC 14091 / BCRC 22168 / CBS 111 / JCM 3599 / NBRC 0793 / NRRL Y-1031 F-60-10) TaxID=1206466 RepID=K0KAV3_WICCF|nr:putative permease [Wickerhamomyces ciferrii]CCH42130.1 putative permease [Wickerhamomyces ciferrii]